MVKGNILLIGASGMLARALQQAMDAQGLAHLDVDYPQLDLANPQSIAAHVTGEHAIVINAAAWTDVDGAEDPAKYPLAESVNGTGVGELALCCRRVGAMLVHYSTDYVFNGQASEPYRVDQPHDPINAYGRSKALGERLLVESGCQHLLIRTSWLYAPWGKNFVRTIHDLARSKPMLQVVNDQHGRPTSAQHLAHATLGLLSQNITGCWHVTDGGAMQLV
ncbi:MAG: sugar nucleotide-binding protein [Phycisphaerales bacterium]|nr:sugar nucleotide-binding protein [Phycisphaerales bacterium]